LTVAVAVTEFEDTKLREGYADIEGATDLAGYADIEGATDLDEIVDTEGATDLAGYADEESDIGGFVSC